MDVRDKVFIAMVALAGAVGTMALEWTVRYAGAWLTVTRTFCGHL